MVTRPDTIYVVMLDHIPQIVYAHVEDAEAWVSKNRIIAPGAEVVPVNFIQIANWKVGDSDEPEEEAP